MPQISSQSWTLNYINSGGLKFKTVYYKIPSFSDVCFFSGWVNGFVAGW